MAEDAGFVGGIIQDRRTGDSISIQCADIPDNEKCDQLQFVSFHLSENGHVTDVNPLYSSQIVFNEEEAARVIEYSKDLVGKKWWHPEFLLMFTGLASAGCYADEMNGQAKLGCYLWYLLAVPGDLIKDVVGGLPIAAVGAALAVTNRRALDVLGRQDKLRRVSHRRFQNLSLAIENSMRIVFSCAL